MEHVILVDSDDRFIGTMEKMEAHEKGALHRAFSVFLFGRRPEGLSTLLQRRADTKYHFSGLWSNTCCSHPRADETPLEAGLRRLSEELNITCELRAMGRFEYRAVCENGLIEHEVDHLLMGWYDQPLVEPNETEVSAVKWMTVETLERELERNPAQFTPWLRMSFPIVKKALSTAA